MSEIDKLRQEAEELRSKIRVSNISMNLSGDLVAKWVGRVDYTGLACSYSKEELTYLYISSIVVLNTHNMHTQVVILGKLVYVVGCCR